MGLHDKGQDSNDRKPLPYLDTDNTGLQFSPCCIVVNTAPGGNMAILHAGKAN